ncbi:MAG: hypothetical protein JWP18_364 [Solirubrobacterales bacterium]|jgi:hypothetical protein|nr:hypothetical protein [Solirubrobacterales bacterium]
MTRALTLVPIAASGLRPGDVVADAAGRGAVIQGVRFTWLGWLGLSPRVLIRGEWTSVQVTGWPARAAIGR